MPEVMYSKLGLVLVRTPIIMENETADEVNQRILNEMMAIVNMIRDTESGWAVQDGRINTSKDPRELPSYGEIEFGGDDGAPATTVTP